MKETPSDLKKLVEYVERPEYGFERYGGSKIYDLALSEGWVQEGDVIYDLGCGDGAQLPKIAQAVGTGKVYGVDVAPSLVANARKTTSKLSNVEVYQMDARNLETPLEYGTADKVFVSEVVGMVPKKSAYELLNQSILAAKPKGKIIANMNSKEFFVDLAKELGAPKPFLENIKKSQLEYAPGLVGSMFSEEDIMNSPLGEKCSLKIYYLPHELVDPINVLCAPRHFLGKTEKYLVLATKKRLT